MYGLNYSVKNDWTIRTQTFNKLF